jgi:hypothetical protein
MRMQRVMRGSSPRLGSKAVVWIALTVGLLLSGTFTQPLTAQQTSDVTGVVSDPSSAAIVNAGVTLTNEATNSKRTTTTDATGTYRIDGVLVGTYGLQVEAKGFKTSVQNGISISVGQLVRVDFPMQMGSASETVEVHAEGAVIQTDSAAVTTSLPSVAYKELPVVSMTRGALIGEMLQWAPGTASGESLYQFSGNRADMLQTTMEGFQFNYISTTVGWNAIQDVTAITSNAPAEYARPATINASMRSGTNQLHGEYVRAFVNPCLNAVNTAFSQPKRAPCGTRWRQFFDVGGPVYIPHLYDGRNKTFFYFAWGRPNSFSAKFPAIPGSVPTLAMQAGDFSNFPKTIIDPTTGTPFPGNIIPSNRISPIATGVINQFFGTTIGYAGGANNFVNNRVLNASRIRKDTDYALKIDQNIGKKDILAFTYHHDYVLSNDTALDPIAASPENLNTAGAFLGGDWHAGIVETHTFSPRILNQFSVGVARFVFQSVQIDPANVASPSIVKGADFLSSWGIQGIPNVPTLSGMPLLNISNWATTQNNNENTTWDTRYTIYDNLSIAKGKHTIKVGYSGLKLMTDSPEPGPYFGSFNWTGLFSGEPWADFLLGLPSSFSSFTNRPIVARRMWEHGAYAQDDFRVTSKLTLNYGLRWNRYTVPYDKNGLYYNFDPRKFALVVPDQHALDNISPAWPTATFPVITASQAGYPTKLLNASNSFQPRFGFAYQFASKTVLRGGFGLYNGALRFGSLQTGGPFAITSSFTNQACAACAGGALYSMPNPFPPALATAAQSTATGYNLSYRPAYSENWTVTLEREFVPNWNVQLSYHGVANRQILFQQNLNAVQASTTPYSLANLPFPGLGPINFIQNGGNSWYNGVEFKVTHPFGNGLYTTAAYTREWSGGLQGPLFAQDQAVTVPEYSFNKNRDYGPDPAYPAHDFIWTWVWQLPVGRGHRFGSSSNRILNGIIGGWEVAGSASWRSGWFFTPDVEGVDIGNIGTTSGRRPDKVAGCDPYAGGRHEKSGLWFNPACFAIPANGQLGNAGVNSLEGPGAAQVNFSPYKVFPLKIGSHEGAQLRIGANITNLFNQTAFSPPVADITNPSAGKIVSTTWSRGLFNDEGCCNRAIVVDMRLIY